MDVLRIVSPVYGENCYVVVTPDKAALVVDPGAKTAKRVEELLNKLGAKLGVIVLTHGHADHLWNTAKVQSLNPEAPIYLATPDHFWLQPPGPGQNLGVEQTFVEVDGPWQPVTVQAPPEELFCEGGAQLLDGLVLRALPAPGHSPGCTMFFGNIAADDHGQQLGFQGRDPQAFCFTGDVIFRGSIGRTDLRESDPNVMQETLRMLRLTVNPDTLMLPGHGPCTTWFQELETNPFLPRSEKVKE